MEVLFSSRHPEADRFRRFAVHRTHFTMKRFADGVSRVRICLDDANGPKKGDDKICRVEVGVPGRGAIYVSATASEWHTALDDALERAARTLVRTREKAGTRRRLRHRHADVPAEGDALVA